MSIDLDKLCIHNPCMGEIERITNELESKGFRWADLAKHLGVSDQTVYNWRTRGSVPKRKLTSVAGFLGVTTSWILTGEEPTSQHTDRETISKYGITTSTNDAFKDVQAVRKGLSPKYLTTEPGPDLPHRVPLISATTAGHWAEVVDNFQPGDAERWIEVPSGMGGHAFALRIRGDSMEPTIRDGWIVVVDPDCPAEHGKIVVVRQNSDTEATCKRLIYDGATPYLRPDNDRYPIMEMREDAVICGVVRRAQVDFD